MPVYKKQPIEIILDTTNLSKEEIQEAINELVEVIGKVEVYVLGEASDVNKINRQVVQLAYCIKEKRLVANMRIQPHVSADIYPIYKRKRSWIRMIVERRKLQIIERRADDYIDFLGRFMPEKAKRYATERLVKCIKEAIEEVGL